MTTSGKPGDAGSRYARGRGLPAHGASPATTQATKQAATLAALRTASRAATLARGLPWVAGRVLPWLALLLAFVHPAQGVPASAAVLIEAVKPASSPSRAARPLAVASMETTPLQAALVQAVSPEATTRPGQPPEGASPQAASSKPGTPEAVQPSSPAEGAPARPSPEKAPRPQGGTPEAAAPASPTSEAPSRAAQPEAPAAASPKDPVAAAIAGFGKLATYRVTLRSSHGTQTEVIRYFYKKPGYIRMEFVKPHNGAVLVYDPTTKYVRLKPFRASRSPTFSLTPDNRLVKSPSGHRVDESDMGKLLDNVKSLQENGQTTVQGEETIGGRQTLVVSVEGRQGFVQDRTHRFLLNLDKTSWLPLKVASYDTAGKPIEVVLMDDLETDVTLEDSLFKL